MVIDLSEHLKTPFQKRIYRLIGPTLEKALGFRGFEDCYRETSRLFKLHPQHPNVFAWFDSAAHAFKLQEEADLPAEFSFPKQGPLIIVANHPFGVIDPVMLARWVGRFRPDMKVMTNSMLLAMEELAAHVIPVDPFGGEGAAKRNLGPMKEAIRLLRSGGALIIFPAGEVASYKPGRGVEEPAWSNHVGSLVRRTQATVLPVYFPGSNSALFHAAGMIHPRLRTGLLLREFCNRENTLVQMNVGQPIPFSRLKKFEDDESLTRYLRIHTFVLHQRGKEEMAKLTVAGENITIIPPSETQQAHMVEEIDRIRARGGRLVGQGNLSVYQAHSHEIPALLPEIGRLREITFREVGEGSGNDIDLDKYDRYYEHLILWDEEKEKVAGAYRLGRADIILREYGSKGLYTSTLFRFEKPFLANLEHAVEMGRSFIIKAYQRNLATLPLLWKGIAHWISRNPHYKKLFGPVSISKDYSSLSRKMIVEFLQDNRMHPHLSSFVKARNPFRYMKTRRMMREFISADLQNVDDCSALISSLETDGKGIPILLKHYLKLNATLLSFNVDKDFSSVVDGLIMVDFTETDPRLLSKYMGEENCRQYLASHKKEAA
ncbi:lysophospholipid acyltransferase family protein [Prosthecobacter sp.]|uniref:lysophospholipid acyltransferase family protein n=1 Tax=Prosthecobacter sp. TaxID=1965333 RepID=UPI0024896938|nr:lysophospholipid acyltransferase family protein [Prosthecobacter sp.]MDI1313587.1 lysophospholipid acyltransferase family protein [Prosthecobacter sp.]